MCSECEVVFHEKAGATSGVISLIICRKKKPPQGRLMKQMLSVTNKIECLRFWLVLDLWLRK